MDQDNDGVISEKDVKGVLDFLGKVQSKRHARASS